MLAKPLADVRCNLVAFLMGRCHDQCGLVGSIATALSNGRKIVVGHLLEAGLVIELHDRAHAVERLNAFRKSGRPAVALQNDGIAFADRLNCFAVDRVRLPLYVLEFGERKPGFVFDNAECVTPND